MAELDPGARELLESASFVHLATLLPDGAPHSTTIWAGIHEGRPYFFTRASSLKGRNIARDPRVALSVVDRDNPYRTAQVRGHVVETIEGDEALVLIDALSRDYTGEDFPMRSGTVYLIEPTSSRFTELSFADTPPG